MVDPIDEMGAPLLDSLSFTFWQENDYGTTLFPEAPRITLRLFFSQHRHRPFLHRPGEFPLPALFTFGAGTTTVSPQT